MAGGPSQLEQQGLIDAQRQLEGQVRRLVLETAIGPVLPLSLGNEREARWDWAAATGGVTQDPPCSRAARQGPATTQWRSAAEPNVQPGWLVKPLPRRGAWKGLRHRLHNAADRLSLRPRPVPLSQQPSTIQCQMRLRWVLPHDPMWPPTAPLVTPAWLAKISDQWLGLS
jgi:hypothetical protein